MYQGILTKINKLLITIQLQLSFIDNQLFKSNSIKKSIKSNSAFLCFSYKTEAHLDKPQCRLTNAHIQWVSLRTCSVLGFLQEVWLLQSSGQMKGEERYRSARSGELCVCVGCAEAIVLSSAWCSAASQRPEGCVGVRGSERGAVSCRCGLVPQPWPLWPRCGECTARSHKTSSSSGDTESCQGRKEPSQREQLFVYPVGLCIILHFYSI